MITKLDVPVPANRDEPQDCYDLHKQGLMYRAQLKYVIHFAANCLTFWHIAMTLLYLLIGSIDQSLLTGKRKKN